VSSRWPAIPAPEPSLAALQTTVSALKEAVELLTGQRGPVLEYSVDQMVLDLQSKSENAFGRVFEVNEVQTSATKALASRTTILEGEVFGTLSTTLNGKLTDVRHVVLDAGTGLVDLVANVTGEVSAARQGKPTLTANFQDLRFLTLDLTNGTSLASQINSVSTTVGGHTSSISTLLSSVNGIEAQYKVVLTLDGVTGGYKVVGVQKTDGTGRYTVTSSSLGRSTPLRSRVMRRRTQAGRAPRHSRREATSRRH
jgi:hypothetical protein